MRNENNIRALRWREQSRNRDVVVSRALSPSGSSPTMCLSGEHAPRSGVARYRGISTRGRRPASASRDNVTFGRRFSSRMFDSPARQNCRAVEITGGDWRASAMYSGQEIKCCPVILFPRKKKEKYMYI